MVRAGAAGMGVVHQDLGLVPTMTVAENIDLGCRRRWRNPVAQTTRARGALAAVGLGRLDPHKLVESLNLGTQALIAVAKVMSRGARVVVVDELTAGLHPDESRWLVGQLRATAHRGATVVMVTHKLREVEGAADRYVVLVDGRVVLDRPDHDVGYDELVAVMSAGRVASEGSGDDAADVDRTKVVCSLRDLYVGAAGPIDLDVQAGEVVALTGLVGSGLHDIAYAAAGRMRPRAGRIVVDRSCRRACVPAHRESEGMFPEATAGFNLSAGTWARWRGPVRLLSVRRMTQDSAHLADQLSVVPRDLHALVSSLSGGNQQKTLLGRALLNRPDLLVLCEPTRGVDVATRREIYRQVRRAADYGTAVLLASTDMEDLVSMADRATILDEHGSIGPWVAGAAVAELALEVV